MRRWWLTIVLNSAILLSVAAGCYRGKVVVEERVSSPDSTMGAVVLGRDKRNPVERQDHWGWNAPLPAHGEVSYYVVEYQLRNLSWAVYESRRLNPPPHVGLTWAVEQVRLEESLWRRLGVSATNAVWIPQNYAPYRIRVRAYFLNREWLPDSSPGFGPVSVPSDWMEKFVNP
jgi:hypothetical protein